MIKLREISIDRCHEIGRGAHGTVYQTAPDMLVKVYNEKVSINSIQKFVKNQSPSCSKGLCRRSNRSR